LEDNRKWYVITTKSRAEKRVSLDLAKLGIDHFLPLQKHLKQWKDRKKWVELPLFNSYIFVYTAEQLRNEVFEVPGVVKYLAIKGSPCVLKQEEIERIKKICNQEHEVTITQSGILTGDEVEVTEGPLKGLKGRITEKGNNSFLYIQIENLGFTASFKIEKNLVKRLK
jgi:transcription antitermination factor NusG